MPGFFDTYEDGSGLNFVGKEEKEVLISTGTPFPVLRVSKGTSQFGERFIVITTLDDEERAITFSAGSVESRDRLLDAMMEYLTGDEAVTPTIFLERKNRSVLIREYKTEEAV